MVEMRKEQSKMEDFLFNKDKNKRVEIIKIIADSREVNSKVINELSKLGAIIELKILECGDFIVSDKIIIERKTSEDFCSSIIDGRLFEQAKKMKEYYEKPILLIEGNPLSTERNLNPKAIMGAISSLITDFNLSLVYTRDFFESALFIFSLAKREQIIEKREPKIRSEKKPLSLTALQEYLVAGLPNVNVKIARRLLEKFKTVEKVFTASEEELKKVDGIGDKISKKIRKVLTAEYSPEKID
jgi:Fanconi anemia group M protein